MAFLRGDELTQALLPTVADLVVAVHDLDEAAVGNAFAVAERLAGDAVTAARTLAVMAAGMASEDHSQSAALGWTLDPTRYVLLRDSGTPSLVASQQCVRGTGDAA